MLKNLYKNFIYILYLIGNDYYGLSSKALDEFSQEKSINCMNYFLRYKNFFRFFQCLLCLPIVLILISYNTHFNFIYFYTLIFFILFITYKRIPLINNNNILYQPQQYYNNFFNNIILNYNGLNTIKYILIITYSSSVYFFKINYYSIGLIILTINFIIISLIYNNHRTYLHTNLIQQFLNFSNKTITYSIENNLYKYLKYRTNQLKKNYKITKQKKIKQIINTAINFNIFNKSFNSFFSSYIIKFLGIQWIVIPLIYYLITNKIFHLNTIEIISLKDYYNVNNKKKKIFFFISLIYILINLFVFIKPPIIFINNKFKNQFNILLIIKKFNDELYTYYKQLFLKLFCWYLLYIIMILINDLNFSYNNSKNPSLILTNNSFIENIIKIFIKIFHNLINKKLNLSIIINDIKTATDLMLDNGNLRFLQREDHLTHPNKNHDFFLNKYKFIITNIGISIIYLTNISTILKKKNLLFISLNDKK